MAAGMRSLKRERWNVERGGGVRACGKFLISFSSSFTRNTANFQFAAQMRDGKLELDGEGWRLVCMGTSVRVGKAHLELLL